MKKSIYISLLFVILMNTIQAQSTVNANNATAFVFGGDQQSNSIQVNILPIAILDVEPDPGVGISFGGTVTSLEAGLPAFSTINVNEELWVNFTHRSLNSQNASINVAANQAVPASMTINVEIITTGAGGNFSGNPAGVVSISQAKQSLISNIPNGFTGDGLNSGYQLKYTILNPNGISLPTGFEINYTIE